MLPILAILAILSRELSFLLLVAANVGALVGAVVNTFVGAMVGDFCRLVTASIVVSYICRLGLGLSQKMFDIGSPNNVDE